MDLSLNLIMKLPDVLKKRLLKGNDIELDNRTMHPGQQIILYILEKRRITKDIYSLDPQTIRDYYNKTAGRLQKRPPRIKHKDHQISVDDGSIRVREYFPKKSTDHQGQTLLYFHGGGFSIGSLRTHDPLCKHLVSLLGWRVFSVEYRLAPEHRFPIPLEDCDKAMDWLVDNADSLGVDTQKIAIGGDSAGANLSTCLCIKRLEESKLIPERQYLLYPGIDSKGDHKSMKTFTDGDGYFLLTKDLLQWFHDNYMTEEDHANPYVAPMQYKKPELLPPAVVITAGFDPLRDEGLAYYEFLKNAGVKVFYKEYEDLIHGFANFTIEPKCYEAVVESAEELKKLVDSSNG